MNRYYNSISGSFISPDPYKASGGPGDPGSWNRYAYVSGDPINLFDPAGTCGNSPDTSIWSSSGVTVVGSYPCVVPSDIVASYPIGSPVGNSIAGYNDLHGIVPKCLLAPTLPPGIADDQIQQNIDEAQSFYEHQAAIGDPNAIWTFFGFLAAKFAPGGDWDYKKNYSSGGQDRQVAQDFGNFDFGAVLESLGFSYAFTQNAAGVAQIGICMSGGACGKGIPLIQYPFGDQLLDAAVVHKGWDYQARMDAGCQ